jgi:catalase
MIPVNCPFRGIVSNYQRDGFNTILGNGGSSVNYEPNSFGGPVEDKSYA